LGGIWTSGLLCLVLDGTGKCGLVEEIGERLEAAGARRPRSQRADFLYDPETMKVLLEDLCNEAGVHMRLHTRVVAAIREDGLLRAIVTESPSGREAFTAPLFVDSTGNGDLAAYAQCAYDHGHPVSGKTQPATLFAIISGVPKEISGTRAEGDKERFRAMLNSVGIDPSYQSPSLFPLPHPELHCLMINRGEELLSLWNVTPIPATGQPFDPSVHHPVDVVFSSEVTQPIVVAEVQRGYRQNGELIRQATVVVAKPANSTTGTLEASV
jgi:hypothetical protein